MNFDPMTYTLQRVDRNEERIRNVERIAAHHQDMFAIHSDRLERLEAWKRGVTVWLRRWPYLMAPVGVMMANLSPKEVAAVIVGIIKVLT